MKTQRTNAAPAIWNASFYQQSSMFLPIAGVAGQFMPQQWPSLDEMNRALLTRQHPILVNGNPLKAVAQDSKASDFFSGYEQQIYLNGCLQTRTQNWHDYLNLLVWMSFPETKSVLNQQQYSESLSQYRLGKNSRSLKQNTLAQFDECGVIICCSNPRLYELLQNHCWKELFYDEQDRIGKEIEFFIFGHGLFEKALIPYIGMTGKGMHLSTNQTFFSQSIEYKIGYMDHHIAEYCKRIQPQPGEKMLQPVPLLGVKDWYQGKQDVAFYQNKQYFRDKATEGR